MIVDEFTPVEVMMTAVVSPARSRGATGLLCALVSALTFGASGVVARPMLDAGWSPGAVVLIRLAGGALLLAGPAVWAMRGRWASLRAGPLHLLGYGLVAVGACQYCFFEAVRYLPVGVALLLEFCGPVLVVAWLWCLRRDRPRPVGFAGMLTALAGLVLVLGVVGGHHPASAVGVLWGLGAAVGNAGYFLMSVGSASPLPAVAQTAAGLSIGAIALAAAGLARVLPLRAGTGQIPWHRTALPVVAVAVLLAVLVTAVPYVTGIAGIRALGSRVGSFVGLTEVLFAVLLAWLLIAERPSAAQLVGGLLICGGVALVKLGEPAPPRAAGRGAGRPPARGRSSRCAP